MAVAEVVDVVNGRPQQVASRYLTNAVPAQPTAAHVAACDPKPL